MKKRLRKTTLLVSASLLFLTTSLGSASTPIKGSLLDRPEQPIAFCGGKLPKWAKILCAPRFPTK